jgi:hypothetical protein
LLLDVAVPAYVIADGFEMAIWRADFREVIPEHAPGTQGLLAKSSSVFKFGAVELNDQ